MKFLTTQLGHPSMGKCREPWIGLDWIEYSLTPHPTQYRSFRRRSSQPITWLVLEGRQTLIHQPKICGTCSISSMWCTTAYVPQLSLQKAAMIVFNAEKKFTTVYYVRFWSLLIFTEWSLAFVSRWIGIQRSYWRCQYAVWSSTCYTVSWWWHEIHVDWWCIASDSCILEEPAQIWQATSTGWLATTRLSALLFMHINWWAFQLE